MWCSGGQRIGAVVMGRTEGVRQLPGIMCLYCPNEQQGAIRRGEGATKVLIDGCRVVDRRHGLLRLTLHSREDRQRWFTRGLSLPGSPPRATLKPGRNVALVCRGEYVSPEPFLSIRQTLQILGCMQQFCSGCFLPSMQQLYSVARTAVIR